MFTLQTVIFWGMMIATPLLLAFGAITSGAQSVSGTKPIRNLAGFVFTFIVCSFLFIHDGFSPMDGV